VAWVLSHHRKSPAKEEGLRVRVSYELRKERLMEELLLPFPIPSSIVAFGST
jgi:hypothetical protein